MAARILLVDDDPVSREVISSLLRVRGYDVDTAEDGFTALRMSQAAQYALAFIDYHLPEMDGYALARSMRSLSEKTNPELKMVAITADQFGLAARRGSDKTFDRFLPKPISSDGLYALIEDEWGATASLATIENFCAIEPTEAELSVSPGLALWRARGLRKLPTAMIFPAPTVCERANVEHCFDITSEADADCLILLRAAGLPDLETMRRSGTSYLSPLFVTAPELTSMADVLFEPEDGESWNRAADVLKSFEARKSLLAPTILRDDRPEMRLAAYMFVADRRIEISRGDLGQTVVSYNAGFSVPTIVEAIKRLAAISVVVAKLNSEISEAPKLVVGLTGTGIHMLTAHGASESLLA